MDPLVISVISAATALVASSAGPLVTLAVARRQFNATVLSANRQKWIESLRDGLAELVSLLVAAIVFKSGWKSTWAKGVGPVASDPALLQKLQRLVQVQWRVRLLLNPARPEHHELNELIHTAIVRLQSEGSHEAESEADIEAIGRAARAILKQEWARVKRGV